MQAQTPSFLEFSPSQINYKYNLMRREGKDEPVQKAEQRQNRMTTQAIEKSVQNQHRCKTAFSGGVGVAGETTCQVQSLNHDHSRSLEQAKAARKGRSCSLLQRSVPCPIVRSELTNRSRGMVYLVNYVSQKIDDSETYSCNYAHFHVMNAYAQAQRLTMFQENAKQSVGYLLLEISLKQLGRLGKVKPLQVEESLCYDIIADCLKYYRHSLEEGHYRLKLKAFILKYEIVLNNFMPLYCAYFTMLAEFSSIFPLEPSIGEVHAHIAGVEAGVRQKHNNNDI